MDFVFRTRCTAHLHALEKPLGEIRGNVLHTLNWREKQNMLCDSSLLNCSVKMNPLFNVKGFFFLTDSHEELLQVSGHFALDAVLQSLLTDVLVLYQSCQNMTENTSFTLLLNIYLIDLCF